MSRIFISHSSNDNAAALAIARWLTDTGWEDYFLDITPERGLAPGERWQAALKAAADRCEAVLFLISPSWQQSRWCLAEFLLAKQLGKAIFGVLIAPTPLEQLPGEMTAEWQVCDLVQGSEQVAYAVEQAPHVPPCEIRFARVGLDRLRIGLRRAGLDPSTFPWPPPNDPERSPYPGLRALDAEDAAVLFGRDAMIVRGLDQLRRSRERGTEHLFVIVGASGAGKSSFMRAGLLPRLARDDRQFLPLPVIRPERAAINGPEGLLVCLGRAFKACGVNRSRAQLRAALQQPQGLALLLRELREARPLLTQDAGVPPTVVIPIDQGEELFAADAGAEGRTLLAHLDPLVAAGARRQDFPHTMVLASIRADSLGLMQSEPGLQNLPAVLFNLPPVARGEFKSVIEGPAARHTSAGRKLSIDPALTEHLMADAEGADALPLLALTLERLYLEHGADGALTLDAYERMGGLKGSIEAAVEAAFADPSRSPAVPAEARDRLELLRQAFVPWLAAVDPDTGERKRRVARWEDISEASRPLIDRLVSQHLLVKDRRRIKEGGDESSVVEVAHEALIRQWSPLRSWLDDEEADLRNLENVRRAAAEWARNDTDAEWLVHTGERLDDAEALMRWPDFKAMLGEQGIAYLGACRKRDSDARAEREAQLALISRQQAQVKEEQKRTADAQKRTARFQRWTNFALAGVAVVLAGTGWWVVTETRDVARQTSFVIAQNAERVSNDSLATRSVEQLGRALRLSVAASRSSPLSPAHPAAALQLARAAQAFRGVQVIELPPAAIRSGAWSMLSPDGLRLLAYDAKEGTAWLWDVASGKQLGKVAGLDGGIENRFVSGGRRIVSWSRDGKASPVLWDAATGRTIARLEGHDGNAVRVDSLLEGTRLITTGRRSAPRLWDAADGRLIAALEGHDPSSAVGVFPSDGKQVISRGNDNALRLWDAADGRLIAALEGHSGAPSWAFNRDGTRIVTYRGDDVPLLWDAETGRRIASLEGRYPSFIAEGTRLITMAANEGPLIIAAGTRLITSAANEAPPLWDARTGKRIAVFDESSSIALAPGGDRLATMSKDGAARLWDSADGREVALLRPASAGRYDSPGFSPDGRRLWLQTGDATVAVWDAVDGVRLANVDAGGSIESASFKRGGTLLLTGSPDAQRLWDGATGKLVLDFPPEVSLHFGPGDTHLVVTRAEGPPQLWSTSGVRIADLEGHTGWVASKFSSDGSRLVTSTRPVTSSEDVEPRLWDTATGRLLATLSGHSGSVRVIFTRDNTRLLTRGRDNEPRLWDAADGRLLAVLSGHTQAIRQPEFSGDQSRVLTVSDDGAARIWDAELPRQALYREGDAITHIAATADGQRLIASIGRTIDVLRVPEGDVAVRVERPLDETLFAFPDLGLVTRFGRHAVRVLDPERDTEGPRTRSMPRVRGTLDGHSDRILSAWIGPSIWSSWVATASADRTARISNAADGSLIRELKGHGGAVEGVTVSRDGKLILTRAADHLGRLWDAETGRQTAVLTGHTDAITSIASSPKPSDKTERVITASADGTARVWDAETGRPVAILSPHPGPVGSATLAYDDKRAVTVSGHTATIWDVEAGARVRDFAGGHAELSFASLNEQSDCLITVDADGEVRVWDAGSGKEIARFQGDTPPWRAFLGQADAPASRNQSNCAGQTAVAVSKDGSVRAWDVDTRALKGSRDSGVTINVLALDAQGKQLIVGWSDGIARLHDAATGQEVLSYLEHEQPVTAASLAPDGSRAATGSADGTLKIWSVPTGKTVKTVRDDGDGGAVGALAFSPDGTILATAQLQSKLVRVLDAQTGEAIAELSGHENFVRSLAFSADGRRLVTTSKDETARVWDVTTRKSVAVIEGLDAEPLAAKLDPTGTRLVTAFANRSSRVWDVTTGELLAELDDGGGPAGFAAFPPDGKRVITASKGGVVGAWDIEWLARARDRTLIEAVCRTQLAGSHSVLTDADVRDAPLLTGRVGEDVCAGMR